MKLSRVLYLGTDPSHYEKEVVHCPLIETKPLPLPETVLIDWEAFTHIILTSPNAARILASQKPLQSKEILAIGKGTARGLSCSAIAFPETQEGMIELLKKTPLENSYILYPRSSIARPLLAGYLKAAGLRHQICDLYETVYLKPNPIPSLDDFDEIVFTSPSTIKAFAALYGAIPQNKKLTCIGPVTQTVLLEMERQDKVSS